MSRHLEQLASELRHAIQATIDRGLQDPRIEGMITVTGVRLSPDQKVAHVTVSVLPAEKQSLTFHGLKSAAAHLRHAAGDIVRTRHIPELHFHLDETLKKQAEVMGAIARAADDRARREAAGLGPAYADDAPPEGSRS